MPLELNDNESKSEPATSNTIYEIVMVALAVVLMLVCVAVFLFYRRCKPSGMGYDHYTGGSVSTINVNMNSQDNSSPIDLQGTVNISYVNEKSKMPPEIPIGKVTLSRDALLYISMITCINLPDNIYTDECL